QRGRGLLDRAGAVHGLKDLTDPQAEGIAAVSFQPHLDAGNQGWFGACHGRGTSVRAPANLRLQGIVASEVRGSLRAAAFATTLSATAPATSAASPARPRRAARRIVKNWALCVGESPPTVQSKARAVGVLTQLLQG